MENFCLTLGRSSRQAVPALPSLVLRGLDADHGGILDARDRSDYLVALLESKESLTRREGP